MTIVEADGWREEAERLRAELAEALADLESARADRDDWEARAREAERRRDLYVALLATADEEDD